MRDMDWSAIDDDAYDGQGSHIGYGRTRKEAIMDLLGQIEDDNDDIRFVECEACGGEGRKLVRHQPRQGEASPDTERDLGPCEVCKGNCFVEEQAQPVEMNDTGDLDMLGALNDAYRPPWR